MNTWSGRAVTNARSFMARRLPAPCARCNKPLTDSDAWVVGHIKSRITWPELTFESSNWQIECRPCSDASAQRAVQEKAAVDALRSIGLDPRNLIGLNNNAIFPNESAAEESPPLPFSLAGATGGHDESPEVSERLQWAPEALGECDWLQPFIGVPEDAAAPLAMTPPHPEAVGSYGAEAIEWIETSQGITLRWWQRLAITRQLEHREDGSLCWRTVVESCPRRAGKSVRIRGMALWRMAHSELIGEVQTVVHCGNDLPICREIQRGAWRWARDQQWKVSVGNGKESIESPDGSRWLVRSQDGVYGWDAGLAVVDESWDVKPDTVSEGLEPAMLERLWAQLHLTSTAHRRATSLMKTRITEALTMDDRETLLLLWAAPAGSDPGDPETWKAASPHWSEDRRRMIASKYEKALAGEADPEADDPDPMQGFTAQYLNIWQLKAKRKQVGDAIITEDEWEALSGAVPDSQPDCVAVEGWTAEGISVARSWRVGETVTVSVDDFPDVASAAALIKTWNHRRPILVGTSLATDPAWKGMRVKPTSGTVRTGVQDLARMLTDGVLRHDGGEHLTSQVVSLRTSPSADGLRRRDSGRLDALKAAVWAAQSARTAKSAGKPRILVAV